MPSVTLYIITLFSICYVCTIEINKSIKVVTKIKNKKKGLYRIKCYEKLENKGQKEKMAEQKLKLKFTRFMNKTSLFCVT